GLPLAPSPGSTMLSAETARQRVGGGQPGAPAPEDTDARDVVPEGSNQADETPAQRPRAAQDGTAHLHDLHAGLAIPDPIADLAEGLALRDLVADLDGEADEAAAAGRHHELADALEQVPRDGRLARDHLQVAHHVGDPVDVRADVGRVEPAVAAALAQDRGD